jgi:hypothetical protein
MHAFDTAFVPRQKSIAMAAYFSVFRRARRAFVKSTAAAMALLPAAPGVALTRLAPVRIEVTRVVPRSSRQAMRR